MLSGCGASTNKTQRSSDRTLTEATIPQGHPQAVEPVAGQVAPPGATGAPGGQGRRGHSHSTGGGAQTPTGAPLAPATITNAPARGAPTDAEVRAAIARFQLAVARYHLDRLDFSNVLLNPATLPPGVYNVSIASVFTDYGLPIACGGVLHVPELGVANKTLPCGTMVLFRYGNRAVRVPVIDRGPYIPGREWDLTGATAEALHFPGLGPIEWRIG